MYVVLMPLPRFLLVPVRGALSIAMSIFHWGVWDEFRETDNSTFRRERYFMPCIRDGVCA